MDLEISESGGAVILTVRVVPRASKSAIVGELDGALKVRIASPPVDGAANAELIKLMAKTFGAAKADVEIVSGQTSKQKRVRIGGVTASHIKTVLKGKS